MAKHCRIQSFDSEIIYNSEQSWAERLQGQNSFINDVLQKQVDSEESTRIKKETIFKKIQKKQKIKLSEQKIHLPTKSGKWSGSNRTNYYKGILKFSIQHPFYKISWKYWKPEKFYPKMVEQINKNEQFYKKDVIQTKSFDERQRKEYFQKGPKLDMIDIAIQKMKEISSIDQQAKQILIQYQEKCKTQSIHMKMLDESIKKVKGMRYDFEDLYSLIIGEDSIQIPEQINSCFYS